MVARVVSFLRTSPAHAAAVGLVLLLVLGAVVAAFSGGDVETVKSLASDEEAGAPASPSRDAAQGAVTASPVALGGAPVPEAVASGTSRVIRTAVLSVGVDKDGVGEAYQAAQDAAARAGGWVQSSERVTDQASLVLKIPSDRFDAALESLGELGEVRSDSVAGEDVSAEYVDAEQAAGIVPDAGEPAEPVVAEGAEQPGVGEEDEPAQGGDDHGPGPVPGPPQQAPVAVEVAQLVGEEQHEDHVEVTGPGLTADEPDQVADHRPGAHHRDDPAATPVEPDGARAEGDDQQVHAEEPQRPEGNGLARRADSPEQDEIPDARPPGRTRAGQVERDLDDGPDAEVHEGGHEQAAEPAADERPGREPLGRDDS